uniref:Uncharacterized protein n=1 Tax=Myotis myotis TaxID=51298 RepID=A0A7J7R3U8_MYOMY|nr:hypothetical protein mMyoMyo1_010905 [Myotis myotis]
MHLCLWNRAKRCHCNLRRRQLLQIPVQPQGGVHPGRLRPVSRNDRRQAVTLHPECNQHPRPSAPKVLSVPLKLLGLVPAPLGLGGDGREGPLGTLVSKPHVVVCFLSKASHFQY